MIIIYSIFIVYCFSQTNELCDQTDEKKTKFESSYFDDIEGSLKSSISNTENKQRRRNHLFRLLLNFSQENISSMIRNTNFLHTMASVTVR